MSEPVNAAVHPAATKHLPAFITAPGETDTLMVVMAFILIGAVLGFGILFLRLHTLPERVAHKGHKIQFEIVAILGLIALFTHMHIFWIIGLLLAFIDLPDFGGSLSRIAGSTEKLAGIKPGEGGDETPGASAAHAHDPAPNDRPIVAPARLHEVGVSPRPDVAQAGTRS